MIGDWYFALDGRAPTVGRFHGSWRECFRHETGHALFVQDPCDFWVGMPLGEHSGPRGRTWLFGGAHADVAGGDIDVRRLDGGDTSALGGRFVLLRRRPSGELSLDTDRFGTLHVYRGPTGFGSCAATVSAGSARRLDWQALAGFFAHGFFPAARTHYDDVEIFRPARHHRLLPGSGRWTAERTRPWSHHPDPGRSYEDVLEAFCTLFRTLMDELDTGRLAIPISGGLDSRLTVAALGPPRDGRWSYAYGYSPDSVETRIAAPIARRRSLPFDGFTIGPYLFDRADQVLGAVEGFQDVTQSRQVAVAHELRRRSDAVVAAHWGDVWLDDMGLFSAGQDGDPSPGVAEHTLGRLRKNGRHWLLENLCRRPLKDDPEEIAGAWVHDELKDYAHLEDPDFRVKAFKTDHWSFRFTLASLRAYELGAAPRLPFYDPRLGDFFAGVPTAFVAGRRLEIDAIKRLAPDLARIPWQVYDASLYRLKHFHTWQLPKRAIKKAWRLLRRKKVVERNWEVQFLSPDGRRRLENALLTAGRPLHDLVPPAAIADLLDDFYRRPAAGIGYTVSMLLTFSWWLDRQ